MNGLAARVVQLSSAFALLLTVGSVMTSHAARPAAKAPQGLPTDWTHRHVVFSQPRTLEQMKRVGSEARYWQQFDRRVAVREVVHEPVSQLRRYTGPRPGQLAKMKRDWSVNLGSGGSVGAGNFPAKYGFQTETADCNNDYVTFATGLAGSGSQASIVAYNTLYTSCSGTVPSAYWAYNTGGTILTSPVISQDGTQISFVQTNAGAAALVLLKWAAGIGTVTAPTAPASVTATLYPTCTAPCMNLIPLTDNHGVALDDTTSSVFYDYGHDVAWVGSAGGWLHKIAPAFKGSASNPPQEVTTGGFPVQLNGGATDLSNPVFDSVSGNVFVGDMGGFLYQVSGSGTFTTSGRLDFGVGLVSGPIVDSTAQLIYAFASNNGTMNCTGGTGPCSSVYVFPVNFTAGSVATDIAVGGSVPAPSPLYEGAFDNAYQNSTNATGNLYVCGNTGQRPILYQIPIKGGVMGPVLTGPGLSTLTATANCSPVTDVYNPNTPGGPSEWVYAGPSTLGFGNNCNHSADGCIISFKITPWIPSTAFTVGQEILDTNFQIQVVLTAGTSGATAPAWNTTTAATTTDGSVTWLNQSKQSPSHGFWFALTPFSANTLLVDSNNNIEYSPAIGLSGATTPVWTTNVGGTTPDGTITWQNLGPIATFSLDATGGVSGIIIDNVVGATGDSQVYFTTLSDQACPTSGGTGGCAIQASQSALQ
jgi:hypothetical protein